MGSGRQDDGHRFGRYATAYSAGIEAARLNLLDDVRGRGKSTEAADLGACR